MLGFEFPTTTKQWYCYHNSNSQPPPCTSRFSLLSASPVPSSAPALFEYELDQLSVIDCHKHHTIDTVHPIQPVSISGSNDLHNNSPEVEASHEIAFSPLNQHEYESDATNQDHLCENKQTYNNGKDDAAITNLSSENTVDVSNYIQVQEPSKEILTKSIVCTRADLDLGLLEVLEKDGMTNQEDVSSNKHVIKSFPNLPPVGNVQDSPQFKTTLAFQNNSTSHDMMSIKTCSQRSNSNSLFGENISDDTEATHHSIYSHSNEENKDNASRGNVVFGERAVLVLSTDSEQIERDRCEVLPSTESEVKSEILRDTDTSTCLSNRSRSPTMLQNAQNADMIETHAFIPNIFGGLGDAKNVQLNEDTKLKINKSYSKFDDKHHLELTQNCFEGHTMRKDFAEEYSPRNCCQIYLDRNLNDNDLGVSSNCLSKTPQTQFVVVTPQISSPQSINSGLNNTVSCFENNQGYEISFSPLCDLSCYRNDGNKTEENMPNEIENHIRHDVGNCETSYRCRETKDELHSSQIERNYTNEDGTESPIALHNPDTKSEEIVEDLTSTQPFLVTNCMSPAKQRHTVASSQNIEQELTFSPLCTQVCHNQEEPLNQNNDSKSSHSVLLTELMPFLPLKNDFSALTHRSLFQEVNNSTNRLQLQFDETFQNVGSKDYNPAIMKEAKSNNSHLKMIHNSLVTRDENSETETYESCDYKSDKKKISEESSDHGNSISSNSILGFDSHGSYPCQETIDLAVCSPPVRRDCQINNYSVKDGYEVSLKCNAKPSNIEMKGIKNDNSDNHFTQHSKEKDAKSENDNLDLHNNVSGEQVVPENMLIKSYEGCHNDSSFYDIKCLKDKEGKFAAVKSHQSSFQWKSVYDAVLVNNSHENAQHTAAADHLESITPLPFSSSLKRPRPLRVGLSKKQKIRHLHEK